MRRSNLFALSLVATVLWGAAPQPALAQARKELGPLCTSVATPADKQIDACNKIIALKVFSGEALATIYFWRGVAWTKKGDYTQVIADTTEALRLWPGQVALYNQRGSAYYDKGEYDIAISDFNDAMAPQVASSEAGRAVGAGAGLAAPASLGAGATHGAGTLIAFATAPGQVALDGEGSNSPFSAALSRHIGTPGLEVQQMLTRVRAEVVAATRSKQVPWSNSSLLGEVFLAAKP